MRLVFGRSSLACDKVPGRDRLKHDTAKQAFRPSRNSREWKVSSCALTDVSLVQARSVFHLRSKTSHHSNMCELMRDRDSLRGLVGKLLEEGQKRQQI